MVDKLLKREDANVFVVSWEQGAGFPYHQAVGNSRLVGAQFFALLELLHSKFGLKYENVHIIGSGVGAHIAGYAGRNLKRKNESIARITGMYDMNASLTSLCMNCCTALAAFLYR